MPAFLSALPSPSNHQILGRPREFAMDHAGWGPQFSSARNSRRNGKLDAARQMIRKSTKLDEAALLRTTARHIAEGKVIGWYQGRGEWGPRALGTAAFLPIRAGPK